MVLLIDLNIDKNSLRTNDIRIYEDTENNKSRWKSKIESKMRYHKSTTQKQLMNDISLFGILLSTLLLWTIFFDVASCQIHEIEVKINEIIYNETNEDVTMSWLQFSDEDANIQNSTEGNPNPEVSTHTWLQLMDLDVEDTAQNISDENGQPEETTMSWLQMMNRDVIEDGESNHQFQRLQRDLNDIDSGSGSGISDETTTDPTSTTFVETTTESEGSGISQASTTIEPATEMSTIAEIVSTPETTEETTSSVTSEIVTKTTTDNEGGGTTVFATSEPVTVFTTQDTQVSTEDDMSGDTTTANQPETTAAESTTDAAETTETTTTIGTLCSIQLNDCPDNQFCAETSSGNQCKCIPGTTLINGGCETAKQFGGKLHIDVEFNPSLEDPNSDYYKDQETIYLSLLVTAYGSEDWYISVIILGFSSGSTVVEYELVTTDGDVDSTTIEGSFASFLNNSEFFTSCSCDDTTCSPNDANLGLTSPILANSSCNDAGTATDILCENPNIQQFCDDDSTTCDANLAGVVTCQCNDGFVDNPDSENSCIQIICTSNSDCNSPFGECEDTTKNQAGRCLCIWGFYGNNCNEPWLFVFIIVLSFLVLVGIIAVVVCAIKKRHRSSMWKKPGQHYEEIIMNTDGIYVNKSEWDDTPSGIVSKTFKRIENESYENTAYSHVVKKSRIKRSNDQNEITNPYDDDLQLEEVRHNERNSGANGFQNENDVSWRVQEGNNGAGFTGIDVNKYSRQETEF